MDIRITLRINKELNRMLEHEKAQTKKSKNTIIIEACQRLIEQQENAKRNEYGDERENKCFREGK